MKSGVGRKAERMKTKEGADKVNKIKDQRIYLQIIRIITSPCDSEDSFNCAHSKHHDYVWEDLQTASEDLRPSFIGANSTYFFKYSI